MRSAEQASQEDRKMNGLGSSPDPEPIAIVGIGCRLPGNVSSASDFWQFVVDEQNAYAEFPTTRFGADAFHSRSGRLGTLSMRGGCFFQQDVRSFDNTFFGISNLEAQYLSPSQRNLLEVVFECFESGGIRMSDVAGTNVGCYVGDFIDDDARMKAKDPENVHKYSSTGGGRTLLANRLNHAFDLRGPSLTLDTGCSSSLYCLHLACRALFQNDCSSAIVAAVNIIQSPELYMEIDAAGVLSPTSICHTFDATADGYARGEATCALYIKKLSDAIRDGDPIRSIIRSTSVNTNGHTIGITSPSIEAQEAVMAKAYDSAGLVPQDTDYVECHGTGTPVGDLVEVTAVAKFFACDGTSKAQSAERVLDYPLLIGAVKPNFGHNEAASGLTSIIKVTLALEKLLVPATIGIKRLNPSIPWEKYNLEVVRSLREWPLRLTANHVQRASVNSFAYGGANAHCILERADSWIRKYQRQTSSQQVNGNDIYDDPRPQLEDSLQWPIVLPLSAKSLESVNKRIEDLAAMDLSGLDIQDLAFTLIERRSIFSWRGFVTARSPSSSSSVTIETTNHAVRMSRNSPSPITFIFAGQGAQWPRMGQRLYEKHAGFRQSIRRLDEYLCVSFNPPWSLSEIILGQAQPGKIDEPVVSQTVMTAIQIALVDLLRCWGILPSFVVGHSSGEIGAAYAANHISSLYALDIAYLRGYEVSRAARDGAMVAVDMDYSQAIRMLERNGYTRHVTVACINSPESVTISGDSESIDKLMQSEELRQSGRFVRKLRTGGKAYHSYHMRDIAAVYEELLVDAHNRHKHDLPHCEPDSEGSGITMISTVWNRVVSMTETSEPRYWRSNLESPVQFGPVIQSLLRNGGVQFIEIGSSAVLSRPVSEAERSLKPHMNELPDYLATFSRGIDSDLQMSILAGTLWTMGYPISLTKVNKTSHSSIGSQCENGKPGHTKPQTLTSLPNYPWDHSKLLWVESRSSIEYRQRQFPQDELLGARVAGSNGRTSTWRNHLNLSNVPWINDHKVGGDIVLPGACYVAMASRACQQLLAEGSNSQTEGIIELRHVRLGKILVLDPEVSVELFTELSPLRLSTASSYDRQWTFTVTCYTNGRSAATVHAAGDIGLVPYSRVQDVTSNISLATKDPRAGAMWYTHFAAAGLNFGLSFQSLSSVSTPFTKSVPAAEAHLATITSSLVHEHPQFYPYDVHPIVIDSLLQTALIATSQGEPEQIACKVPTSMDSIKIWPTAQQTATERITARALCTSIGHATALVDTELVSSHDQCSMRLSGVKVLDFKASRVVYSPRCPMLRICWQPDTTSTQVWKSNRFAECLERHLYHVATAKRNLCTSALVSMLHLLLHNKGSLKVLEIKTGEDEPGCSILEYLDTTIRSWISVTVASTAQQAQDISETNGAAHDTNLSKKRSISGTKRTKGEIFDVIICSRSTQSVYVSSYLKSMLASSIGDHSVLLIPGKLQDNNRVNLNLEAKELRLSDSTLLTLATRKTSDTQIPDRLPRRRLNPKVLLIVNSISHPLNGLLERQLQKTGRQVTMIRLNDDGLLAQHPDSLVVVTAELEAPFLTNANQQELVAIQNLTENFKRLLWITNGNLITPSHPESSAAMALSRHLMAQDSSIKFVVFDLDCVEEDLTPTIRNIESMIDGWDTCEREYLQKDNVLHISRILPDSTANFVFQQKKEAEPRVTSLDRAGTFELSIKDAGQFDTLYFAQTPVRQDMDIPADHVEVCVKAAGLNAKDIYTLSGKFDTVANTCSCEFSGIIVRVGSAVQDFARGDRIVSMAPGRFRSYEYVPSWACMKIKDDESFLDMAVVPVAFATAVHALCNVARLQPAESILLHSAAGGVGHAAIVLAKEIGAQILVTAGSEEKRKYLSNKYGIESSRTFNSRDTSFMTRILGDFGGVDVILNSLTGEKLHASLETLGKFGRFVEIGKRDILDAGILNMHTFLKGMTFSAFDLHDLYHSSSPRHQMLYSELLHDAIELFRRTRLFQIETTCFPLSRVSDAFQYFSNRSRIGKVAVSFEDTHVQIPLVPRRLAATFSPTKSYLLVGCLGGLGRSIARYMLLNGARNFTFLSRSGAENDAAREFVANLSHHASVNVVRGSVTDVSATQAAVDSMPCPLGGVIQAAMAISQALFHDTSLDQWQSTIAPKIRGTWNLHHAIDGKEAQLDFFLLTSSTTGSIGFPTENSYSVANSFLDYFAAYRRSKGLKATAVALGPISDAGYLHEHGGVDDFFFRAGITPLSKDDMLTIIDTALTMNDHPTIQDSVGGQTTAHILTGLEPLRAKLPVGSSSFELLDSDPRMKILNLMFKQQQATQSSSDANVVSSFPTTLPSRVAAALASRSLPQLKDAVFHFVAEQLGRLLLLSPDDIARERHPTDLGVDSTLMTQLRATIFKNLNMEVPLTMLMDTKTTVGEIEKWISERMFGEKGEKETKEVPLK